MKSDQDVIYLKDYQPHPYRIEHSDIHFNLDPSHTTVTASHQISRRNDAGDDVNDDQPLVLDCEKMSIVSVEIDGELLVQSRYRQSDNTLSIEGVPANCTLRIINTINPGENTELSGLYRSSDMLCTQCEAEGFRRITPAIDRPDNLATYRVTLQGSSKMFPVMLSNGNLESSIEEGEERIVVWHDPFPKPTYLFAIVAGSLSEMRSSFVTQSGREVSLRFYASDSDIDKCEYAMDALKRSMKWDEEVYGREYDLDLFNVVAVGDFNMGAMENKSLNIFNTKYVLADADLATDTDFMGVESVVAHEYFHNWSGNRVTCRDWFQLSLKEGLTVFRDQEFSADTNSAGVQRIGDVNVLRNHQFPEDAGPMAHPVRPAYYQEINNFYTVTIYEKGAEVVRMLRTLAGTALFRKGTDLYFDRHDGQAVTTDDFIAAIADASGENLEQFKRWYSQAGTPRVLVSTSYGAIEKVFRITLTQSCPETPDGVEKKPFLIPVKTALLDREGNKYALDNGETEVVLRLSQVSETFEFQNIASEPVASILRGFTSPVILKQDLDGAALTALFLHDDDPYNRWEAGQQLLQHSILENIKRIQNNNPCRYDSALIDVLGLIFDDTVEAVRTNDLSSNNADLALISKLLTLPGQAWLSQLSKPIDPHAIAAAHHGLSEKIAASHYRKILELFALLTERNNGALSQAQMALRSLRDTLLKLLASLDTHVVHELAETQLKNAFNMTDRAAALDTIINSSSKNRTRIIDDFYTQWSAHPLVVDKWLRMQATSRMPGTLQRVIELTKHEAFDASNPNKIYALILGMSQGNPLAFHETDESGYRFLADWIVQLDQSNPQIAARLASGFNQWQDMTPKIGDAMRETLVSIQKQPALSSNVSEIVTRALA